MPDTHGPIDDDTREVMSGFAQALDQLLNQGGGNKYGFALLVFPFGEGEGTRMNYISNANRDDMRRRVSDSARKPIFGY